MSAKTRFILVTNESDASSFDFYDLLLRKNDEKIWSMLMWRSQENADKFLKEIKSLDKKYKIIEINKTEYDDFLSRTKETNQEFNIELFD